MADKFDCILDDIETSSMTEYEKKLTKENIIDIYDVCNKVYEMCWDDDVRNYMRKALGWDDDEDY